MADAQRSSPQSERHSDKSNPALVLILERTSMSVAPGLYQEVVQNKSLTEWWFEWTRGFGDNLQVVLCHTDHQASFVRSILPKSVVVYQLQDASITLGLYAMMRENNCTSCILTTLLSYLLPTTLVADMLETHRSDAYELSWAPELPIGCSPIFIESSLLEKLLAVTYTWLPTHPALACFKLRAAKAAGQIESLPFEFTENACETLSKYQLRVGEIPSVITLVGRASLDILTQVVLEVGINNLDSLKKWKCLELARLDQLFRNRPSSRRPLRREARLLFVASRCGYSGAEESLVQLARKLDRKRFEVSALLGAGGRLEHELSRAGARVTVMESLSSESYLAFREVKKFLREQKPDLIHLNAVEGPQVLWNITSANIPFVLHVRNGDMSTYRETCEAADALISVSGYLNARVQRFNVSRERTHVVFDEVDTMYFRPGSDNCQDLRCEYRIPQQAPVILMIARFTPNKRHDLMLEAFSKILKSVPSAYLVLKGDLMGSKQYFDRIKERINTSDASGQIIHIPWVENVRSLHEMASVLVLCSDDEGLGRCVVEAMAMQKPVVVTDTGGTHEIVRDGETGFVVPGSSVDALAAAVVKCLVSPELQRYLGRNGRRVAIQQLDSSITAQQVSKVYSAILGA